MIRKEITKRKNAPLQAKMDEIEKLDDLSCAQILKMDMFEYKRELVIRAQKALKALEPCLKYRNQLSYDDICALADGYINGNKKDFHEAIRKGTKLDLLHIIAYCEGDRGMMQSIEFALENN
jgi:hypothetical protein